MASLACRLYQIQFRPGLCPDPAGVAYDAPPDTQVGWGGGHPLPILHPLDALGVSPMHRASPLFKTFRRP